MPRFLNELFTGGCTVIQKKAINYHKLSSSNSEFANITVGWDSAFSKEGRI